MKKTYSTLALILLLFTIACKKENKENRTDLITSGNWKMIGHTIQPGYDYDGDGDIDTDIFPLMDACEKDNSFLFKKDGTLEINEGATKCDQADPQVYAVGWEFRNDEKKILVLWEEFEIDELTNSRMKLRQVFNGDTEVLTFGKQ